MEQINSKNDKIKDQLFKTVSKQSVINFLKNNLLTMYIIFNLSYILIGTFLVKNYYIYLSEFANGYITLLVMNLFAIIALVITKKYRKDLSQLFIFLIIIFAIISTIFAINKITALYGMMDRWEGLFSILYYLTLVFLTSFVSQKNKKKIVYFILFSGVIQALYGIGQVYNIPNIERGKHIWATGFIQNPNFFSTYMLLNLSYAIGLYIDEKKTIKNIVFIALSVLYMTGLLISNSSSGILGLAFVLIYIFIYCIKNKKYKKLIVTLLILLSTIIINEKTGKTHVIKDTLKVTNEATQVAKGNAQDNFGSGRMFIWKETMKIVPKYLIHGVGIDNFGYAFDGRALVSKSGDVFFEKAHNEYLQTLVTQGIFSLISYLGLYILVLKKGIKECFKNKETYLIIPIIGYLVQAFFNISVIEVAPIFHISLGLVLSKEDKKD